MEANIIFTEKKITVIKKQYNPLKPKDVTNLSKKPTFQTLPLFLFIIRLM